MVRMGLGMVAILAPLQAFIGDLHGLNTAKYQPVKVAAMEAHWDGSTPGDLVLFAIPNEKEESNDFEISIPNIASLIITHDLNGLFKGLKDFKPEERPPVKPVFYAFRAMVGIGLAMIGIGLVGALLWWRGRVFDAKWYLWPVQHSLATRLHRHPRRMVGDGDRPPTVDRHGHFENRGCGIAGFRRCRADDAHSICTGLHKRVLDGHPVYQQADREGPDRRCDRA